MARYLPALALFLGFAFPVGAAPPSKEVTIRWHGQSFFEIESSQGARVVIDPHAIQAYGRLAAPADLVLISHLHTDHMLLDAIPNRDKARIIPGLKGGGRNTEWNPVNETFRDIHVRSVGVFHDDRAGLERGKNTIFILEVDGVRIVHLGDLGHLLSNTQRKQIGPVDVLLIPVGGVYTINGSEAKQVVEQLRPRQYIIPMHYGTKVYEDLLPATEFLEDQANVQRIRGNKITTEAAFQPPAPIIAVQHWK